MGEDIPDPPLQLVRRLTHHHGSINSLNTLDDFVSSRALSPRPSEPEGFGSPLGSPASVSAPTRRVSHLSQKYPRVKGHVWLRRSFIGAEQEPTTNQARRALDIDVFGSRWQPCAAATGWPYWAHGAHRAYGAYRPYSTWSVAEPIEAIAMRQSSDVFTIGTSDLAVIPRQPALPRAVHPENVAPYAKGNPLAARVEQVLVSHSSLLPSPCPAVSYDIVALISEFSCTSTTRGRQ